MYPALAVVGELVASSEAVSVLWVGGEGGMEASLVGRAGIDYVGIPAAGLHGVGLRSLPANAFSMLRGTRAARGILRQFQPDVLFYTGGYVGVPMAYAGRKHRQAMYVPDIEPALALRWISRWVGVIAVTNAESRRFYKDDQPVVVTGYPTRASLKPVDKLTARQRLGLSTSLPTILVFGGSRGARSINRALQAALPTLLEKMQVLHISGELDWPQVKDQAEAIPSNLKDRYQAFDYVHEEMNDLLAAADLVVSRAGAAILGEYPLFGLPAILIPYPHAWRYQRVNAGFLEEKGAALVIQDDELEQKLAHTIEDLIVHDQKRAAMAEAMRGLHTAGAAAKIARILLDLSHAGEVTGG